METSESGGGSSYGRLDNHNYKRQRTEHNRDSARLQYASNRSRPQRPPRQTGGRFFGRVMDSVPCRNRPRTSTLSIAVPGSILTYCQTKELRTLMVGQIARAATIYHVDEIVVFDDKLSRDPESFRRNRNRNNLSRPNDSSASKREPTDATVPAPPTSTDIDTQKDSTKRKFDPHSFMARLLQYCECPQYLRKQFFPMHPDLQFSGLLAPIDAPHHVRAQDRCKYREGVVMEKQGSAGGSLVNCGIRGRPVEIDIRLKKGIRCTVQIDVNQYGQSGPLKGKVVSPASPREENGTYWGYTTRMAGSLQGVFDECPFEEGYDMKIGTSERGNVSLESKDFSLPHFEHAIIVFGGVAGIEECVDADESIRVNGSNSHTLFDQWANVCPYQGSRTIRTEEAILITLAKYSPFLTAAGTKLRKDSSKYSQQGASTRKVPVVNFSDDDPSDESSAASGSSTSSSSSAT